MKYYLRTLAVILVAYAACTHHIHAQTLPSSFNYQGRLTDTAGTPLPNGDYQMIFSIWDAATGGNQLWGSGNKTVVLNKGLFTTSIGPITTAALPAANTFLQVQLGTDTPMPRIALGAVPYALKAVELLWPAVASISNTNPVLTLTNTGSGPAISALNTGTGWAGTFTINNPSNSTAALLANTNGSGNALHASTSGSGAAIKATPGSGLAGLFEGIIQTNGFKMATGAADGYMLSSDAAGLARWKRDGLTLPWITSTTTSVDAFNLVNFGTGRTMRLSVDNAGSTMPTLHVTGNQAGAILEVDGQAIVGGLRMPAGAANGYVLKSDSHGVGSWQRADAFANITASGTIKTKHLEVDSEGANTGTLNSGGVHFGYASGEGIFSKRTPGGNQFGLDIATNHTPRISITQAGDVGIGVNPPQYPFHVKGVRSGGYTAPLTFIENTNNTGSSSPALRLGGSGNSVDGVLNVSNFGTGKIAVFGGNGGEVANIDVDGNLSARNLPAVAFVEHNNKVNWNDGDVKFLETLPVRAPSNGYFIVDGYITGGAYTSDTDKAEFELVLYDATSSSNKILLKRTLYTQKGAVRIEQDVAVRGVYPAAKGQSITFQMEGHYFAGSYAYNYWTDSTSLRVLFVPNQLTP